VPDTVRERVLAALYARLGERLAPTGDGGDTVPLRRNPGPPQTELLAVDQYDGGHDTTYASDTAHARFDLAVELELFAPDGPSLNELYGRVRDAIDLDVTLGEVADDTTERGLSAPVPGTVQGHPDILGAVLTMNVQFRTRDQAVREPN
jgi:hypothetical protein